MRSLVYREFGHNLLKFGPDDKLKEHYVVLGEKEISSLTVCF